MDPCFAGMRCFGADVIHGYTLLIVFTPLLKLHSIIFCYLGKISKWFTSKMNAFASDNAYCFEYRTCCPQHTLWIISVTLFVGFNLWGRIALFMESISSEYGQHWQCPSLSGGHSVWYRFSYFVYFGAYDGSSYMGLIILMIR